MKMASFRNFSKDAKVAKIADYYKKVNQNLPMIN